MRRRLGPWLLAVSLVVLSATAPGAQTQRDLSVSPSYGEISTDAGRMVQDEITVVNLSDEDIAVIVSPAPLEIGVDGAFRAPASSDLPSAVPWGAVEPSTFNLPRGNSRVVTATFTPPAGTPAGGYYAAVRVTGTVGSRSVVEQIHPVLLQVAGDGILTRRGRLVDVEIPATSVRTSIPVTLTLENTGNVHVIARGTVAVFDAFSNETQTVPVTAVPVLPNRTRRVVVSIDAPLVPWSVTARAQISFGRGSTQVTRSASGYSIPWWGLAGYAIVLFLIARLVLALVRRRRRRRGARAVERGAALPAEIALERAELEEVAAERSAPAAVSEGWDDSWEIEPVPREREFELGLEQEVEASAFAPPVEESVEEPEPFEEAERLEEEERALEEPLEEEAIEVLDLSAVLQFEEAAPQEELLEEEEVEEPELPEPIFDEEPERTPLPPSVFKELEDLESPPPPEPEPEPELEPEPESEPEPKPEPEPEPEPEPVRTRGERAPVRAFSRGAGLRRVRVALDMLTNDADESKLDVGLEMLETLREQEGVAAAVAQEFDERRSGGAALALEAIGSDRAPSALIEAYGSAKGPVAERLRAAIGSYPVERLRAETEAVAALPKKRREELGLR